MSTVATANTAPKKPQRRSLDHFSFCGAKEWGVRRAQCSVGWDVPLTQATHHLTLHDGQRALPTRLRSLCVCEELQDVLGVQVEG